MLGWVFTFPSGFWGCSLWVWGFRLGAARLSCLGVVLGFDTVGFWAFACIWMFGWVVCVFTFLGFVALVVVMIDSFCDFGLVELMV